MSVAYKICKAVIFVEVEGKHKKQVKYVSGFFNKFNIFHIKNSPFLCFQVYYKTNLKKMSRICSYVHIYASFCRCKNMNHKNTVLKSTKSNKILCFSFGFCLPVGILMESSPCCF